jgi:hypothetical protein
MGCAGAVMACADVPKKLATAITAANRLTLENEVISTPTHDWEKRVKTKRSIAENGSTNIPCQVSPW